MPGDKPKKPARRRPAPRPKDTVKAHLRTLDDLDKRTRAARDTAELRDTLASDLGGDLSAMESELVTSAALVGAMIRDRATAYLAGERVDLPEFMSLTNSQRRLLSDLGYDRRLRNVTPRQEPVTFAAPGLEGEGGEPVTYEGGGLLPSRKGGTRAPAAPAAPPALWSPGDPLPTVIEFHPPGTFKPLSED